MNSRSLLLLCSLFLLGAAGLPGCSKAPQEQASRLQEGYGKTIDPYEPKNGKGEASRPATISEGFGKIVDPYESKSDKHKTPPNGKGETPRGATVQEGFGKVVDPYAKPPGK